MKRLIICGESVTEMNYIKSLKFIIISIALSLCVMLQGEIFQLYIQQFDSGLLHTTFVLPKDGDAEQMNSDLKNSAEKHNLLIFKVEKEIISTLECRIDVFAEEEVQKYLYKNFYVKNGCFKSALSGKVDMKMHDFLEAPASAFGEEYTLIGSEEDALNFKLELMEKYPGALPKVSGVNEKKELTQMYCAAWAMLILLCCLITIYECAYQKKEVFVRMTLGENTNRRILRSIFTDSVFIVGLFIVLSLISYLITKTRFLSGVSWSACAVLVISNSLAYIRLRPKGVKSLTGYEKSSQKLLSANYFLKSVCVVLTCLFISSNIACISECINYYRQKDFFNEYSDYYSYNHFSIKGDAGTDSYKTEQKLYNEFRDDMKIFFLCNWMNIGSKKIASANINTKEYLSSKIKDFDKLDFSKSAYILIRKGEKVDEEALKDKILFDVDEDDFEIFYYEADCEIVVRTLDSDPNTTYEKNPVIFFYNADIEQPELFLCMLKTDKAKLEKFSEENDLTYSETNVLDYFNHRLLSFKRLLYLNSVLSAIMIFIELLVTVTVIRMEYSVNAVALALKKVFGYSNINRFSSLYIISVLLWVFSTAISLLLSYLLHFGNYIYIMAGALLVLIFDLVIISLNIKNYDRKNIQKILKGGAL